MSSNSFNELIMTKDEKESFIRFNSLLNEIKDVNQSIEIIKKRIQLLNDANDESMLVDDEDGNLLLNYGTVFIKTDYATLEDQLNQQIKEGENELKKLEIEKVAFDTELAEIKKKLYARFGDRVVLG